MGKCLIIGCGGVASVAIHKCCQNSDVFTEICIASRTKAKCDALKEKLEKTTSTKITTEQVNADHVDELIALIEKVQPDVVLNLIGLSHSGWRGTVAKIGKVTVEKMKEEYGCHPEDILAAIGPSICQDCYEVSEDVIEEFKTAFAGEYQERLYYKKKNGKYQLNLWETNRLIFLEAGIPEANISMPGICTCCNPEFLFSHRASHGKRGNLAAFLGLK